MDTVTTSYDMKFLLDFADTDTRTLSVSNPKDKSEITEDQIKEFETLILNGGTSTLLIGDKTGASFRQIRTVTQVRKTITTLDLT